MTQQTLKLTTSFCLCSAIDQVQCFY